MISLDVDAPVERVFDYLADPRNRSEWQSSLARVEMLDDGDPRLGMRWLDRTKVGANPLMWITELDRPRTWAESGTWRGLRAELTLRFTPVGAATRLTADFTLTGEAGWRVLAAILQRLAPPALRADLRRAATLLSTDRRDGRS